VDLIGPWIVQVHGRPHEFDALTCIDTVTNLVELIRVDDKTSETISRRYAQCWLSRYPWPQRCVHDPGGEFTGAEFQTLLQNCHIRMFAQVQRIHRPMPYAKGCTKQLVMS